RGGGATQRTWLLPMALPATAPAVPPIKAPATRLRVTAAPSTPPAMAPIRVPRRASCACAAWQMSPVQYVPGGGWAMAGVASAPEATIAAAATRLRLRFIEASRRFLHIGVVARQPWPWRGGRATGETLDCAVAHAIHPAAGPDRGRARLDPASGFADAARHGGATHQA